mmetsp:Transcript_4977/g.21142  ORF Transcript_4977/g.21142 Transcript_4977/m.21142 type:complete len:321 (-) Transcript_4977:874-1836(-)
MANCSLAPEISKPKALAYASVSSARSAASASMRRHIPSRVLSSKTFVWPKSIMLKVFPSGPTRTFPGCGSEWNLPIPKICVPYDSQRRATSALPSTETPPLVCMPAAARSWKPGDELMGEPGGPPAVALKARWMMSPSGSPSTKLIVSTRRAERFGNALGVVTSGTRPLIAAPITVNMEASRWKSNSNGTCARYSFKIEVWSNGSRTPRLSANSETASMFFMSMRISRSEPGTCTFTATLVLCAPRKRATCTCAIVAVAIGCFSNSAKSESIDPRRSFSTIFLIFRASTGGQSSNTDLSAAMYCGGRRSDFVANTWPTFK